MPQAEFISAEEVKSALGAPTRPAVGGADEKQLDDLSIAVTRVEEEASREQEEE